MKIENEITGHIHLSTSSRLQIELYIKNEQIDFFALDLENKIVEIHMEKGTRMLLGVRQIYEDYIKLINDLGLDIQQPYKKHWTPKIGEDYFYIDPSGEICPDSIHKTGHHKTDKKRAENYNTLPTRELAEKAINLSKLGRLILLWQYANNCIFVPDWNNKHSRKHYFYYNHNLERILVGDYVDFQEETLYFETKEQACKFVVIYNNEIKELMGVI